MPNPTTAEVTAAKPVLTGGVSVAPLGTPVPTDAATPLDEAFIGLGYIDEEGVAPTTERSTENKKAWGGTIVYVMQTEYSRIYEFTMLQSTSVDVLRYVFGDANVEVVDATAEHGRQITYRDTGQQLPHKVLVIDTFDGPQSERQVGADTQITTVEEGPFVDTDTRFYKVSVAVFPDENGDYIVGHIDDGVLATTP